MAEYGILDNIFLYCFHGDTSTSSSSVVTTRRLQAAPLCVGSHFGLTNVFNISPFALLLQFPVSFPSLHFLKS